MKTFEDSFKNIWGRSTDEIVPYCSLMSEISNSKEANLLTAHLSAQFAQRPDWLYATIIAAFTTGVVVGIEMEKPE